MRISFFQRPDKLDQALRDNESLRQTVNSLENNQELLQENLVQLELALEDANWMRLMLAGEHEFSRDGIKRIAELARTMVLKNPLIKRQVMVQALYVWSQGVTIRSKNKVINQVLQDFWDDEKNRSELTSHQALMLKEIDLQAEGNLFFVFFTRPTDGRVRVRTIPPDEIVDVICDPQDARSPWYYKRTWTEKQINPESGRTRSTRKTAYYPDWRYHPNAQLSAIGGQPVQWDAPIYHVKTGGLAGWKFGLSEVYASIDWARAYKDFLEDVASLMRSYSRFAWNLKFKGGKKTMEAAKSKLNSTLGDAGTGSESNPAPVAGSTFLGSDLYDLQPMNIRGASISPDDGRRLLLMVASSAGLPETYFGDVSVGTLATAKTMDRPTELAMRNRQMTWTDILRDILTFVILQALKASADNEIQKLGSIQRIADGDETEEKIVWGQEIQALLDIDFPPILERDVQTAVQSIVTAATLNGQDLGIFNEPTVARLLLTALAQDDVDEIMTELYPDETVNVSRPDTAPSEAHLTAAFVKAVEAVVQALDKKGVIHVAG
jgi:hypothetical protein